MSSFRWFWAFVFASWIVLLVGGWHVLLRHAFTPGSAGSTPSRWPANTVLALDSKRPTLVLFAHRNCPCTRATLAEMKNLLMHCAEPVPIHVVLVSPTTASDDRVGAEIEALARELPGAEVRIDTSGEEARRFQVRTSGHVLLYDVDGRLLFSGGLTESRGHAGDSSGQRAVLACLRDGVRERNTAAVYGCPLFADDDEGETEDER
jgi:hypothetical protein